MRECDAMSQKRSLGYTVVELLFQFEEFGQRSPVHSSDQRRPEFLPCIHFVVNAAQHSTGVVSSSPRKTPERKPAAHVAVGDRQKHLEVVKGIAVLKVIGNVFSKRFAQVLKEAIAYRRVPPISVEK